MVTEPACLQAHALGSANESAVATVAIGTHNVHSLLLERFHALVWAAVHQRCSWEVHQVLFRLHF